MLTRKIALPKTHYAFAILLVFIQAILPCLGLAFQPELVRPIESSPTKIDQLEFSVVTQDQWRAVLYFGSKFETDPNHNDEVTLQLRIVNRGVKQIVVPTFDSFTAMLQSPEGNETVLGKARDHTILTPPILLKPGQGYSYPIIARLMQPHDGDGIELVYADRTGGGSVTAMKPGTYSLYFKLHSSKLFNDWAPEADLWISPGTTGKVTFRVLSAGEN